MKTTNHKTERIVKKAIFFSLLLMATLAMAVPALAVCGTVPDDYRWSIVTYHDAELHYDPSYPMDSACTLFNRDGQTLCRIRMRGILYRPPAAAYNTTSQFPTIIVNHGSGAEFQADNKHCEIATYFVPKGYIVFVPFRRGQGDEDPPFPPNKNSDKSTGIYMDDLYNDFISGNPPVYDHPTTCTNGGCYHAELFDQQAGREVADWAINYLKNRPDVKKDANGGPNIAIMGNSYGGAVTVLANKTFAGHKAAVAFAAAAQLWNPTTCLPNDQTCQFPVQKAVLTAAGSAKKPAFYLQAKWDYDTRATIDLAYAHTYGTSDPTHGQKFMASVFPYPYPCADPDPRLCTDEEYQTVHTGFFNSPNRWGPYVLEFIRDYGVK